MDEQKISKEYSFGRDFWFLVSFSLLLIVVFVYWLPLRFLYEAERGEMMHDEAEMFGDMRGEHRETVSHDEGDVTEGLATNFNVSPVPVEVGTSTRLDFFVNEKPGSIPVLSSDLQIEHTKLMHVIGVRSDLEEFVHIHPAPTEKPGVFSLEHTFVKPGAYKFWSEVKKDGVNHVMGHPALSVEGEGAIIDEKLISFSRTARTGEYQVLANIPDRVGAGITYSLSFDVHTLAGDEVAVEQYLGADMHLSIIKDDLSEFIHTHPEEHGLMNNDDHHGMRGIPTAYAHSDEEEDAHGMMESIGDHHGIGFSVTFLKAGLYKAFAQFRPAGSDLPPNEALLASFWVRVDDAGSAPPSSRSVVSSNSVWWGLLAMSLIAIGVISLLMDRYLKGR